MIVITIILGFAALALGVQLSTAYNELNKEKRLRKSSEESLRSKVEIIKKMEIELEAFKTPKKPPTAIGTKSSKWRR